MSKPSWAPLIVIVVASVLCSEPASAARRRRPVYVPKIVLEEEGEEPPPPRKNKRKKKPRKVPEVKVILEEEDVPESERNAGDATSAGSETKATESPQATPPRPAQNAADAASDAAGWGESPAKGAAPQNADDLAGFGDSAGPVAKAEEDTTPSPFSLTGFARSQWGLWLERLKHNPFAKGRQNLDLQLRYSSDHWRVVASGHGEYDVAYRVERESYDKATLDAYEHLADVRESYVNMSYAPLELTFGRLIVPWGQGDVTSVLDVTSPRDLREPGLTDLDDLRLPVLASRVGFFFGYHRIDALVIHEANFGYRPAPLGEFSPVRALITNETGLDPAALSKLTDLRYDDQRERFERDSQQYAITWSYKGPDVDLSLYAGSVLDQFGVFSGLGPGLTLPVPPRMNVILNHARYSLFGYSGALPLGDIMLKWEFSFSPSRLYNLQPPEGKAVDFLTNPGAYTRRGSFAGAMVGLTYSGIPNTILFLEASESTPLDGPGDTLFGGNAPIFALRSLHNLMNENMRVDLTLYGIGFALDYGWLARAEVTYRLNDDFKVGLGAITYHPGTELGLLSGLAKHDRVFASLRWDFRAF